MKTLPLISILCLLVITVACTGQEKPAPDEWVELFNGKDLEGWNIKIKGHPLNENYANTFRVEDGKLKVSYVQYEDWDERYGHIFHKQEFSAYLLLVEYRFTGEQIEGGAGWAYRNSGAMLHSQAAESMKLEQDFPVSVEAQFLGGNGQDARSTGNLCTPGTHVVLQDELYTPHCVNSESATYHDDRWVHFEALVLGDSLIKHIVEGDTVLVYEKPQVDGKDPLVDPALYQDGQLLSEGFIALQSESHPVEFRKVMLFKLEDYMDDPEELQSVLKKLQTRKKHL
jgi:hypothetical protein